MELQQLIYFEEIAKCGSLTKAAEKLHTSQPSLSRNLHALEDELGTYLFDRVGRNIVLNNAGRIALQRVVAVLDSVEGIKNDVEEYVLDKRYSVDFYCPVPMGHAESALMDFKRRHPDIRLRIAAYNSPQLANIQPDLTFFASSINHTESNYLRLGDEDIVLIVPKDDPLASEESVALESLYDRDFVGLLPSAIYSTIDQMFVEAGFRPHQVIQTQEFNQLLTFVEAGFGITLGAGITWFNERWEKSLARIPLSDIKRKRSIYLKWPENAIPTLATICLRDFIIGYFNDNYGFDARIG